MFLWKETCKDQDRYVKVLDSFLWTQLLSVFFRSLHTPEPHLATPAVSHGNKVLDCWFRSAPVFAYENTQ